MNILLTSLQNRGYILESFEEGLVTIAKKEKKELLFVGEYTPLVPYNIGLILSNKSFVKAILGDAHVSVPEGRTFSPDNIDEAIGYGRSFGFPLILKQENSQKNITSVFPIQDIHSMQIQYANLAQHGESILVERFITGIVHQVFYDATDHICILEEHSGISYISISDVDKSQNSQYIDVTDIYANKIRPIAKKVLRSFPPMKHICFSIVNNSTVLGVYHSTNRHVYRKAHKSASSKRVIDILVETCIRL